MSRTRQEVLDALGPFRDLRVTVMGAGGVGKSALTIRLVTDNFLTDYDPTIEGVYTHLFNRSHQQNIHKPTDSYRKQVQIDGESVLLDLLDTAGQEEFECMRNQWIREGQAFILVYSFISKETFKIAKELRAKILRVKEECDEVPMVLVANMCDHAEDHRAVSVEEGKELAAEWGVPYFEASAKERINVDEVFFAAFREYVRVGMGSPGKAIPSSAAQSEGCTKKCKKVLLYGCMGFVYVFLCGCIVHLLFLCFAKLREYGMFEFGSEKQSEDEYEDRKRRNELKLRFPKVNMVEEDTVRAPILSLKNFKIQRRFSILRFIRSMLCGLFLPLVVIFQTVVFCAYSSDGDSFFYDLFYPISFPYDKIHHYILLDFLGLVVGRQANEDPDAIKSRDWFLKQSKIKKIQRVVITILLCLVILICYNNVLAVFDEALRVSLLESAGPFLLFWIVWLLLSCWIAYESTLRPPMPSTYRLRSIKLYFGENYSHMTDASKFLRAYAWSRNKKWRLKTAHTFIIILLGIIYALIPGITRLTIGDPSDGLEEKEFVTRREWTVQIGALLVNFVLISSFIYAIEVQYSKHFDNYREWMYDLTMLLNKVNTKKDIDSDAHYMPQKGRNISKDIFLSLSSK